jgi:hypothetical protein
MLCVSEDGLKRSDADDQTVHFKLLNRLAAGIAQKDMAQAQKLHSDLMSSGMDRILVVNPPAGKSPALTADPSESLDGILPHSSPRARPLCRAAPRRIAQCQTTPLDRQDGRSAA